jgi:hypothetical protein
MPHVCANGLMDPRTYVPLAPGTPPVWIDGPTPRELALDELDRRLRREIAGYLLNPYLDASPRMTKVEVCRRFRPTMRQLTKLLDAWERGGLSESAELF